MLKEEYRPRIEIRMFAVFVDLDELWQMMNRRPEELKTILKEAGVKAVHPDPKDRGYFFLFPHRKKQEKAQRALRRAFPSAVCVPDAVLVDLNDPENRRALEAIL